MQHRALFFIALGSIPALITTGIGCKKTDDSSSSSSGGTGTGNVDYTDASEEVPFSSGDDSSTVGPPASQASSCDLSKDRGYCLDYGPDKTGTIASAECESAVAAGETDAGIASESTACSTANRVGSCAVTLGGIPQTFRYYSPMWTTETAQADCADATSAGGAFTPN